MVLVMHLEGHGAAHHHHHRLVHVVEHDSEHEPIERVVRERQKHDVLVSHEVLELAGARVGEHSERGKVTRAAVVALDVARPERRPSAHIRSRTRTGPCLRRMLETLRLPASCDVDTDNTRTVLVFSLHIYVYRYFEGAPHILENLLH